MITKLKIHPISDKDLKKFTPNTNRVLVKLEDSKYKGLNDTFLLNGIEMGLNPTYEREWNAAVVGNVVRVCQDLYFEPGGKMASPSLPWETIIELEEGDKVFINYKEALDAVGYNVHGDSIAFENNEDLYLVVEYSKIYLKIINDQIIPINGYCLGVPQEDAPESFIDIPENFDTINKELLIVTHIGIPATDYRSQGTASFDNNYEVGVFTPVASDFLTIELKDLIRIELNAFIPLEDKRKITLGANYMAFRAKDVQGVELI